MNAAGEWINVDKQLPDNNIQCLVIVKGVKIISNMNVEYSEPFVHDRLVTYSHGDGMPDNYYPRYPAKWNNIPKDVIVTHWAEINPQV